MPEQFNHWLKAHVVQAVQSIGFAIPHTASISLSGPTFLFIHFQRLDVYGSLQEAQLPLRDRVSTLCQWKTYTLLQNDTMPFGKACNKR